MRLVLAAVATTVLPTLVGRRWIGGTEVVRWSIGAVVGIVVMGFGALLGGLLGAPMVGAAAPLAVGWFLGPRVRWDAGPVEVRSAIRRVLFLLLAIGGVLMVISLFRPVASWDGWYLWSLKAKGLATEGSFRSPVFLSWAFGYSSQDYPPLLSSWQAVAYLISGNLEISWPLQFQQAWLWTAGAVGLVSVLGDHRRWAFLLPLAWVAGPQVVWQSIQGLADVPMTLMLVLGLTALVKGWREPRAHLVGGVLLAGAALTKMEGLPLVGIALLCLFLIKRPRAVWMIAPAVVVLARLPWFLFTQVHGLTNHMIDPSLLTRDVLLAAPGRVPGIAWAMGTELLSPLLWGILVPACLATAFLSGGIDRRLALGAGLQLVLFLAVYALWPYGPSWPLEVFMETNLDRVLIAPVGVLALAAGLGSSERARSVFEERGRETARSGARVLRTRRRRRSL